MAKSHFPMKSSLRQRQRSKEQSPRSARIRPTDCLLRLSSVPTIFHSVSARSGAPGAHSTPLRRLSPQFSRVWPLGAGPRDTLHRRYSLTCAAMPLRKMLLQQSKRRQIGSLLTAAGCVSVSAQSRPECECTSGPVVRALRSRSESSNCDCSTELHWPCCSAGPPILHLIGTSSCKHSCAALALGCVKLAACLPG